MKSELYEYKVRIPRERVGVLIGKGGKMKERMEKELDVKIRVKGNEVTIRSEDSIDGWIAKNVVTAIGRGFSPEIALWLKDENFTLNIIDIKEWARSKKKLIRLRGRLIGSEGKVKEKIEKLCNVKLSIYGKTISVIGNAYNVELASKAIEKLLNGSKHSTIFRMLESQRKSLKERELACQRLLRK
ncbi:MAG: KH domain-containing protein [Candidatus Nanoarchaeia archaeon]|nr:KH domain-containing protein [Candidatus Haiyanarchaeum thermophilum]MCW1303141.1 KH domain-containing protein [Candidatus Haiyanarchaeum thermophilum]MCW1303806.1 KH domain-containing protein [Candidatus Haiyanarchaeum thermophilum]MCW1306578.1 KH domain-containing protein [Candidatus Haiyanarchaeum thermophilum]MCW1307662.1 KH domain-containing protein [Candidatus Haiyanarchaeum thermophilum]